MKRTLILAAALVAGSLSLAQSARAEGDKLALAREVIQLTQMDKMFDAMIPQIQQMSQQMVASQLATMSPEQRAAFEAFQKKAVTLAMESAKGMLAKVDTLYADIYSEAELQAMKAYFSSPEGKSMIAKQPQVAQRIMPLMQAMQAEMMPKIQALAADFQKEMAALKAASLPAAAPAVP